MHDTCISTLSNLWHYFFCENINIIVKITEIPLDNMILWTKVYQQRQRQLKWQNKYLILLGTPKVTRSLLLCNTDLYFYNILLLSLVSHLCRISTLIFLRQTMSLGNIVLQLFWCNYSDVTIHGAYIASSCVDSIVSLR